MPSCALSPRQTVLWNEEYILVGYEMGWSVRYFLHKAAEWESYSIEPGLSAGAIAYAARQVARWQQMANQADRSFCAVNFNYISLVT